MKRFLATTATALVLATSAYGAAHTTSVLDYKFEAATNVMGSEFIGMRVYATEADVDVNMEIAADGETEWDDIGEINDVVLTRDGNVAAVIVGVGGFLGIGEKDVALDMTQIKFLKDGENADDYFLVVNASQTVLEEAPEFTPMHSEMDAMVETETEAEMAEAETNMDAMDRPMLARPDVQRDGFAMTEMADLTSENLTGARVYGINDEDVGEVSELILSESGQVKDVIIDVGGFLGIGEKPVAVTFDELNIQRSDDGGEFRVYIDATQEGLEAQPEYQG